MMTRPSQRLIMATVLALFAACKPVTHPSYSITADTIRQGGLEILRNLTIMDSEGDTLFADSVEEYDPAGCYMLPDTLEPDHTWIYLLRFDPCADSVLLLHAYKKAIQPVGWMAPDSCP